MFGTICFLVHIATTYLLLLGRDAQALLRWGLLGTLRHQLLGAPVVPNLMSVSSWDREADKAFYKKTNDKNVDFGEQPKRHVRPALQVCGSPLLSSIEKTYVRCSSLRFYKQDKKKKNPKTLSACSGNSPFTRHLTI